MEKWLSGAEYEQQGGFWRIEGDRMIAAFRYDGDTNPEVGGDDINDVIELTTNVIYLRSYYNTTTTNKFLHKMK